MGKKIYNEKETDGPGFILMSNDIIRSKAFTEWNRTASAHLYIYFQSWIIRSPDANTGHVNIYKEYFLKGKLAAKWSQQELANHFNCSQPAIYKQLKILLAKEFVIKHSYNIPNSRKHFDVYEFGTHNFDGVNNLYALQYFGKCALQEKLDRELEKNSDRYELSD